MTNFRVRLTEQDDETLFTSKQLSLGPLTFSTPCKLFDLNNSPSVSAFQALDQARLGTVTIAERSRFIHQETFMREADHPEARFLADSYEGFLELMRVNELSPKIIDYAGATNAANAACSLSLRKTFGATPADVYWEYARAR
ncbi:MAG: hypothetical protein NTW33_02145, partial [Methanoregula sp.]|nr:hypothetical protein [Methanoregula sp.]